MLKNNLHKCLQFTERGLNGPGKLKEIDIYLYQKDVPLLNTTI